MVMSLASFVMGIVAYLVSQYLHRHFASASLPKDMTTWHAEVENACFEVIRSRIYVAECEKRIIDLVGTVPVDFNPTLFAAPHLAKVMEEALVNQAESQDIWPDKRFGDVQPLPDNVINLDNHEWVAGQLLKKVGT